MLDRRGNRYDISSCLSVGRTLLVVSISSVLLTACSLPTDAPQPTFTVPPARGEATPSASPTLTQAAQPQSEWTPEPTIALPIIAGPEPSMRVAAFYYPWYGSLDFDGEWIHWQQSGSLPPREISSDYYPVIGAYSSRDPAVVAQHFAWLREARIGVIITSWWGQGSREDQVVPLLMDHAERHGMQVAFHIEPYRGRNTEQLLQDVEYIYNKYGEHPAFFRTNASSRWSPDDRPKGLFFLWLAGSPDIDSPIIDPSYWRATIDAIHALPDGGVVLADAVEPFWVDAGHFDGLYNYATLNSDPSELFGWAQGLPVDSWYVPSVLPGFSARRIGYDEDTFVDRSGAATYNTQWQTALDLGIEPAMVTITSFNEWHEGSQIEPAQPGVLDGTGKEYSSYAPDGPDTYLHTTRHWVDTFLGQTWPETHPVRIRIRTSADWTTFGLTRGGRWIRPTLIASSPEATYAQMDGNRITLLQPLDRAEGGGVVEMTVDLILVGLERGEPLDFLIERGRLGWTEVDLMRLVSGDYELSMTLRWSGQNSDERNTRSVEIPAEALMVDGGE